MTILNDILTEKKMEVSKLKKDSFIKGPEKKVPTFKERVQQSSHMNIIAEIKRASPSKGEIDLGVDPIARAKQYEQLGAAAISVLTDEPFFKGSMDDLRLVREAVDIPILCKDFIIDPIQIDFAKANGANIILLIVAALSQEELVELYQYAKELNLEVLIEVHNEEEMKRALGLNPEIIGINNRNLKSFDVSLATTEKLAAMISNADTIIVSESGMKTKANVELARDAGAKAILVGETFMLAEDLAKKFQEFQVDLT